jgi:hypothetical protein
MLDVSACKLTAVVRINPAPTNMYQLLLVNTPPQSVSDGVFRNYEPGHFDRVPGEGRGRRYSGSLVCWRV